MPRVRPGISDQAAARVRGLLRTARSHLRLREDSRRDLARVDRGTPAQPLALSRAAAGRWRARGGAVFWLPAPPARAPPPRPTRAQQDMHEARRGPPTPASL